MITLLRQRLRRDLWQFVIWIGGTAVLAAFTVSAVNGSYGTETDRVNLLATAAANPVIMLFRGLPSGADLGAFTGFLILPFLAMMAAFMSSFMAVRHTRADEDAGRTELVAATPAGRVAPLVATIVHGLIANALLAALVAVAFLACGLPATGSLVAGLGSGALGFFAYGVGLIGAQVFASGRSANAFGVWVMLVAYLVAGLGNALGTPFADLQRIQSAPLAWFSPYGWIENARPWADDNLWPIALCALVAAGLAAASVALQSVRDLGESLLPERRARATAGAALSSSTGLVWVLTWPAILGWAIGGFVSGLLATSLSSVLSQAATQLPSVEQLLAALTQGGSLAVGAIVIFFTLVGVLAACCGVQIVGRARQEEAHGTVEALLATPVGRVRWLVDYVAIAAVGAAATVVGAVAGAAAGLAGQSAPDWSLFGDAAVLGAGQFVAALVFVVVTALVLTVLPRATLAVGWTLVGLATVVGLFGPLYRLPDWIVHLAPIAAAPTVTGSGTDVQGLWWLVAAVVVGGAASLALMRRRELAGDG